jgi:hypothetical protein
MDRVIPWSELGLRSMACRAMLEAVNRYLEDHGTRIGTGTIVDATIIRFRRPRTRLGRGTQRCIRRKRKTSGSE